MELSHLLSFFMLILFAFSMTLPLMCVSHLSLLNNLTDQQVLLSFKDHGTFDPYGVFGDWNTSMNSCHWTARYTHPPHKDSYHFCEFFPCETTASMAAYLMKSAACINFKSYAQATTSWKGRSHQASVASKKLQH
ncbi:hypothetical protein AMTR_s00085p00102040 [Amborella trichopoda]|uniref:Leucine-rich repeat-containing N-terminal plant-type domain-containing protein n=1 Tax=Amborella trichopoda TaxID=13333 RepID=W1P6U9_AMBTC|nr:hypothetical protein AMTR_s00085p00102040 [Amborella trichopoda]